MLAQLHNFKQDLAAAFVLLTRIPLPNACLRDVPPDIIASVWAFPVVGAVIGGAGAIGFALAVTIGLPATASAVIAAAIMVLLTGGFHDDGLADVADGFGGGQTRERKLEIMRDSRIGAYGMLAIILVMGLRVSGFTALSIEQVFAASIISAMRKSVV